MGTIIKPARIFRNGGSQAIRLPKDMRVSGDQVVVRMDYGVIAILPRRARRGSLLELLRRIGPLDLGPRDQPGWTDAREDTALSAPRRRAGRGRKR
jgi:antitoxin VapB